MNNGIMNIKKTIISRKWLFRSNSKNNKCIRNSKRI